MPQFVAQESDLANEIAALNPGDQSVDNQVVVTCTPNDDANLCNKVITPTVKQLPLQERPLSIQTRTDAFVATALAPGGSQAVDTASAAATASEATQAAAAQKHGSSDGDGHTGLLGGRRWLRAVPPGSRRGRGQGIKP